MPQVNIGNLENQEKMLKRLDEILSNVQVLNATEAAKTKVAANYFTNRRTGKVFGVSFTGTTPTGTRLYDAAGMVAKPSTDKIAERNDFDQYAIFNGLTVNGKVDASGEFVVEAFEGEDEFNKTDKDVYVLLGTSWVKIEVTDVGETISVTDKPKEGYFPMPGAVKPDGKIRPFIAIAKYMASGEGAQIASVSGKIPGYTKPSHNWCQTEMHKKGTQYCATTFQDRFLIETYFQVIFATRNSQSIMQGCTNYNHQEDIKHTEGVATNRVLVTKGKGSQYLVGSRASVGSNNANKDRGQTTTHDIAGRRLITKIETAVTVAGTQYDAIYLDGEPFTVSGEKAFISTMPWDTGVCDGVLGSCGSLGDNTSGKYPFVFCGIEMMNGQWEVMSNVIYKQGGSANSWTGEYYVCYDATKLATASGNAQYKKLVYTLALKKAGNAWEYTSKWGFDTANPGVRMPIEFSGNASTYTCDGCYIGNSTGDREVLLGGGLSDGSHAGLWCRNLNNGLTSAGWAVGARLSATGMCGQKSAS